MRIIPRIFVATVAVTLMLSGCVPATPSASTPPKPTATPVFASEAEALAAATKAYAAYSAASDMVTSQGGANPERISPFVSVNQLSRELKGFKYYEENAVSSVGNTKFDSVRIETYSGAAQKDFELSVLLCSDISAIRLVDSSGTNITPANVPNRSPLEVGFELGAPPKAKLIVSRSDSWTGTDFCS
ncbi:hypothetical protein F1C58_04565 [Glaciihabitans sp. INWT7]|uniref:hypothetical protein n=1 Tax=Glaciihabitans sp. INWT7 TaxID=2596912 RepID=UPI00162A159D|nr:hypothetical protein [Glaciihabitans sp. INWT7]QNE46253.1 hypothetical protein F1C58_04565 [Glaciihabitans sp. INWT7]